MVFVLDSPCVDADIFEECDFDDSDLVLWIEV